MGAIEPWHLLILLVIVLIVVGPQRLPEVGKGVGDALREFRRATGEVRDAVRLDVPPATEQPPAPPASPVSAPPPVAAPAPPPPAVPPSAAAATAPRTDAEEASDRPQA